MSRRTWTLLSSVALVVLIGLLGAFVRVPYVALGPGPTYDTLGAVGNSEVIKIDGQRTYPTTGHLNMTTVSLTDHLTLFGALGFWASGRYALAPRDVYYPPSKTEKDVQRENNKAFNDSQTVAETAALRELGYPMKVLVGEVVRGSPADGALEPGDRLISVNGQRVTSAQGLLDSLKGTKPNEQVEVRFQRGNERERSERITLTARPDRQSGFLGISGTERPDVNFRISISLAEVGGPSAGLMFALSIIDKLTPEELNGGQFVAGTGELGPNGEVGKIGGIPFKLKAARDAGATTFLVPAGNCTEAKATALEGLRLVKVGSLDEALKALETVRAGKQPASC